MTCRTRCTVIPLNNQAGGGYDVICEGAGRFFRSGLEVNVELAFVGVQRRKPFRSEPRAPLNELCLLRLLSRRAGAVDLEGKIVDISPRGAGITVDRSLEPGDKLEMVCQIGTSTIRGLLIVLYTEPATFGRFRIGCNIETANRAAELVIEQHVRRERCTGWNAGPPSRVGGLTPPTGRRDPLSSSGSRTLRSARGEQERLP